MTKEDTIKLDKAYRGVEPIMQLLHTVDRELGLNYQLHIPPDDAAIARHMACSLFYDSEDVAFVNKIFQSSLSFQKTVESCKEKIVHNDKFFSDIVERYNGIADLASNDILENLLSAREKFLLDLKNTLENLVKVIPTPQFSEKSS